MKQFLPVLPCVPRRPKGFGFIEFKDPRDAEDAVYKLDRSEYRGREITVSEDARSGRELWQLA